jgi:hypothetical protein
MNPDRIYRQHRDDALARQVTANQYTTFVDMPFEDRFSYRSKDVFKKIICAAATRANDKNETTKPFARPVRPPVLEHPAQMQRGVYDRLPEREECGWHPSGVALRASDDGAALLGAGVLREHGGAGRGPGAAIHPRVRRAEEPSE